MKNEKRTAANRENAKKSTGPKSAIGKATVSQNARTHGLLSRHLIVEGESKEEFEELMQLLTDEFQPVGLVEKALVERIAIALWRQRRLIRAEAANVSLNQKTFDLKQEIQTSAALPYTFEFGSNIKGALPEDVPEQDVKLLQKEQKLWILLRDEGIADQDDPFAHLPDVLQKQILKELKMEANQVNAFIKEKFGSWDDFFQKQISDLGLSIVTQTVCQARRLVLQSQGLPSQTDLFSRYQTALDNDFYKALKVLHDLQNLRESKKAASMITTLPDDEVRRT